jgi:hypothetical protein
MMAGGIGCVVLAGVGLVVAAGAFLKEAGCGFGNVGSLGSRGCANDNDDSYIVGGLLSTAVLTSLGVPLIVIGSRKEPASAQSAATLAPWMGRQGVGLSLRFGL